MIVLENKIVNNNDNDDSVMGIENGRETESIIISNAGAKSTPMATRIKERELSINDLFNLINKRFDINDITFNEQSKKLESKFNELKSDIHEQKIKCESSFNEVKSRFDINDIKFNEQDVKSESRFDEIKSNFNVKLNELNNRFDVNDIKFNELRGDMNEIKAQQNVKFNEINSSLVKQFEKRFDEISESQKQLDEHINAIDEQIDCLLYTSRCV